MKQTIFAFDAENFESAVIHTEGLVTQADVFVAVINHFDPEANVTTEDYDDYDTVMLYVTAVVPGHVEDQFMDME